MSTLEQLIAKLGDPAQFWADCTDCFQSPAGNRVLQVICMIAPPIGLVDGATPHEIGVNAGRQELSAVLWRRSQKTIEPADAPKPAVPKACRLCGDVNPDAVKTCAIANCPKAPKSY